MAHCWPLYFRLSIVHTDNSQQIVFQIKIADDWIRTAVHSVAKCATTTAFNLFHFPIKINLLDSKVLIEIATLRPH